MARLRIEVSDTTSPTVVVLNGEVELSNAGWLRDKLNDVATSGATDVVLDLRDTSFLDVTGLGILLGAVQRLSARGHVVLRSPSPQVRELIDLTVLERSVTIEPPTEPAD